MIMRHAYLFIATLTAGGAERVASLLANEWQGYKGVTVHLVLIFDSDMFYHVSDSVQVVRLGVAENSRGLARMWQLARASLRLRRLVRRNRPTFVLSFMNKYNVYCLASLAGTGTQVIVSERDSPTEKGRPITTLLRRVLYPFAAGVITQSMASKEFVKTNFRVGRVAVMPNPVTLQPTAQSSGRLPVILSVARLVRKKGHADLLRAFSRLEAPSWSLLLCGDGPLKPDLMALVVQLGLEGRVTLCGTVQNVAEFYSTSSIFVLPSYFEGFPNSLAEAMVSGLPPISYDCPTGPGQIIQHGTNGLLVPLGDITGLASAMQKLVDTPALRASMGREARKLTSLVDCRTVCRAYFDSCIGFSGMSNGASRRRSALGGGGRDER